MVTLGNAVRVYLALATSVAVALSGCNASRGSADDGRDAAVEDVALDASGDAIQRDAAPEVPPDVTPDAATEGEPIDAGVPDTVEDVAPDTSDAAMDTDTVGPITDAPLVVYAVEVAGQQELQVVPADASRAPFTVARLDGFDLAYPAFSPSGERIAFVTIAEDGATGLAIVSLVDDGPPILLGNQGLVQILAVDWGAEDILHINALGPADQLRDAVVTVFSLSLFDPSGPHPLAHPGATGQIRAAWISSDTGFGVYMHLLDPPPTGDLWFDGQGGMVPQQVTEGMPIANDVTPLSAQAFLFTDTEQRVYVGTLALGEMASRHVAVTPLGTQDFHPRTLLTGTHFVSSRYPPEVSARPTPRDLVLVSMDTGEVVTRITNTPALYERHPDVQGSETWRP
ncbi:MAG: hypothetical protein ACI81R_001447 [Bradymonadia bacterium]